MGRLGIAAGSSLLDAEPPRGATRRDIATPYGQGMTLALECAVARELVLAYAAVCVVDNLANGVGPAALTAAG